MARRIRQQICANCKHQFNEGENFCPNCGQENHSPNQPIKHYASELVESIFHLDSKVFLTIKTMFLYPGKITREYNENMRARYTPPIRFYIFVSFVFFLLLQIPSKNERTPENSEDKISEQIDSAKIEPFDSLLKVNTVDTIKNKKGKFRISTSEGSGDIFKLMGDLSEKDLIPYKNATDQQIDSLLTSFKYTPNYFYRKLTRQIIKLSDSDVELQDRILEKMIHYSSLSLFFLMPFFAGLLKLSYIRRRKYYFEYLIFSIHYHTVVFLFFSLIILVGIFIVLPGWIYLLFIFGLCFYLGKALRYNYNGSRTRTIIKMFGIGFVYMLAVFVCFLIALVLGVWFV